MVIVPVLLPAVLPAWVENDVVPYVPLAVGQAMYAVGGNDANPDWMLSPGGGALVLVGWIALLLTVGATVLHRRDA